MKNLSLTLFAVLLSTFAFAEHSHNHSQHHHGANVDSHRDYSLNNHYAFGVDPLDWLNGNVELAFEASLNDRVAFFMPIDIGWSKSVFKNNFDGFYANPQFGVKYYVTGEATHMGYYVSPLLGVVVSKQDATGSKTQFGMTYGFRTGFFWNIAHGFYLDGYLGYTGEAVHFTKKTATAEQSADMATQQLLVGMFNTAMKDSGFETGLNIGYAW